MTNGLKGEGPFGDTPGTGVWRSMLTEQYSKSFAKAGGIGISKDVYRELILQQAKHVQPDPGKTDMNQHPQRQPAPRTDSDGGDAGRGAQARREPDGGHECPARRHRARDRTGSRRQGPRGDGVEAKKTELSRRYAGAIAHLKASQKYLSQTAPELLTTLHRHHDVFRAMLQVNLTVLATAHAVSESIVRGVNTEMQRRNIPNTYTAAGRRAAPGPRHIAPLTVSRSL